MKKIIGFIGSFKLSVIVLVAILLLSTIGSFIPQGSEEDTIAKLTDIFGSNGQSVHNFLVSTGLINIYSSPIFVFFIFLFGLNISACTYKLLPFAFKGFKKPENLKLESFVETDMQEDDVLKALKKKGWRIHPKTVGNIFTISKHACGRFGVITIHLGIIVVMIGAFMGYVWGFKAFMNILEGDSDDVAVMKDGSLEPLGFELACDNFTVEYYDNSSRAKSYISELSIFENGVKVKTVSIDVNHPLKHNNIVFYQTNYGLYPNKNAKAVFTIETKDGIKEYRESLDQLFSIGGTYKAKVVDFATALARDEEGRIFSSGEEMLNPAALFEVYDDDKPLLRAWVLQKLPASGDFKDLGLKITFKDLYGAQFTGLSVKKDPGTPLIYIGFFLIGLGIILTYVFNYTVIFLQVEKRGNKRVISYLIKEQRKHRILNPKICFEKLFVKKSEKGL